MLAALHLAEEGVEGVGAPPDRLIRGHEAVREDAMLEAVEFPAGIADLDSSLTHVDTHALTLLGSEREKEGGMINCWR